MAKIEDCPGFETFGSDVIVSETSEVLGEGFKQVSDS